MPIVALDNFCTSRLIGTYHVSVHFWIELGGEFRGIDQVAEHNGQLATLSVWGARFWCRDCHLGSRLLLCRTWCECLPGQGRTTGTAELEPGWIFKATLRTQVLERIPTLTTELPPIRVVKAAV